MDSNTMIRGSELSAGGVSNSLSAVARCAAFLALASMQFACSEGDSGGYDQGSDGGYTGFPGSCSLRLP